MINFSSDTILSSNLIAFPFINLLISLFDFSNFEIITRSMIVTLSLISFDFTLIEGRLEPSEVPEKLLLLLALNFEQPFYHEALK